MIFLLLLLGNQLTDGCAQCLIEGLKNNSTLTSLDLSDNDFGEQGGVFIGGAIVSSQETAEFYTFCCSLIFE